MIDAETALDIGRRLKAIRTARRISQRELSRRSGVANATISQIESGALNPTVGMLKKILTGVPMSLSDFFTYDAVANDQKVFFLRKDLIQITKGGVSYLQVGGNLGAKAIQLLHENYAPGAGTGRHPLKHDGEECGIVLKGRLLVTVGDQSKVLSAGEAYYFKSSLPHSFRNEGNEPCELITACTPPSF